MRKSRNSTAFHLGKFQSVVCNDSSVTNATHLLPPLSAWHKGGSKVVRLRRSPHKNYETNLIHHDFVQFGMNIRDIRPLRSPLFCHSSVVKYMVYFIFLAVAKML